LKDKGYIQRKDLGHQNVHYFIPKEKQQTVKLMLEREALKRDFNEKISSLNSPEDIEFYKKKLGELEKELKRYKRLYRIKEFIELPVLPAKIVQEKLLKMGFTMKDLSPYHYNEPNHIIGTSSTDKITNVYFTDEDEFKHEDVEIKLIPASDFKKTKDMRRYWRITPIIRFDLASKGYISYETINAWILLTDEPIKGYYIIGAYKEYLQLLEEQFHEEWLSWKEKFELSDEDWKEIGPTIREKMIFDAGRVDLDAEIDSIIVSYITATKDDAFERLKKAFMKQGASLEEAEKWAREEVEKAKLAKIRIQQFNELWLRWNAECNALTKEDFASLFRLYQNVYPEKDFGKQLKHFYQWLKKHEKEQINPTYLNGELRKKLLDTIKA